MIKKTRTALAAAGTASALMYFVGAASAASVCSAPEIRQTALNLAHETWVDAHFHSLGHDYVDAVIQFSNIRTDERSTEKTTFCEADWAVTATYTRRAAIEMHLKGDAGGRDRSGVAGYKVQMTDEGKPYITLYKLDATN